MYDSGLVEPDGTPYKLTKDATDLGVWRKVGFQWTLTHEALRAQWPLAKQIRVFFPTFVPLGTLQRWRSPNGYEQTFLRCVIAQSKPGYELTSEVGSEKRRVHLSPPTDFPFKLPGPIYADRTLAWWPEGEEGRTPGKYVDFSMYLEAMKQSIHRRNHQDPSKAEAEDIALLVADQKRHDAAIEADKRDWLKERRKERRRHRVPKIFVPGQSTPAGDDSLPAKE